MPPSGGAAEKVTITASAGPQDVPPECGYWKLGLAALVHQSGRWGGACVRSVRAPTHLQQTSAEEPVRADMLGITWPLRLRAHLQAAHHIMVHVFSGIVRHWPVSLPLPTHGTLPSRWQRTRTHLRIGLSRCVPQPAQPPGALPADWIVSEAGEGVRAPLCLELAKLLDVAVAGNASSAAAMCRPGASAA